MRQVPHGPQMPVWAACPWLCGLEGWSPHRGRGLPTEGMVSKGAHKNTSTFLVPGWLSPPREGAEGVVEALPSAALRALHPYS